MLHAIKLLFIIFRNLIFENKDEYNIRSPEFKPKKMIIFILITLSFLANIIVGYRVYTLVNECIYVRKETEKVTETKSVKKPTMPSSDS